MCGICGFINHKDDDLLKLMTDSLIHRGPDEEGYYSDDFCSLGIRRLSIIDLKSGSQPYFNENKKVISVFNGEIYNFEEIRELLVKKGHKFNGFSDGEILPHLYEEYGEYLFKYLRGMFSFAIYDVENRIFILARDHFGIKPIFYFFINEKLFFASEIKACIKYKNIKLDINPDAVDLYFTRLYIPCPFTIYKNIKKLPPANYLIYKNGKYEIKKYWSLKKKNEISKIDYDLIEEIDYLLNSSVKEQIISDVPLGLFLSGGLDSSAILYYLSRNSNDIIKTFTISYMKEKDYDESKKASIIADFFNSEHKTLQVNPNIKDIIYLLAKNFDQPFADSSAIVTYLISKEARKYITVALTGIGGDEIFGGYPRYLGLRFLNLYKNLPYLLRKFLFYITDNLKENNTSFNYIGRLKRFFKGGSLNNIDNAYIHWISYIDEQEKKYFYNDEFYSSIKSKYHFKMSDIYNNLMAFEIENYLEGDLLYLGDMSSMMNSLELRVPFLDLRLVELMNNIPLNLKLKYFSKKYILKKILKNKIPDKVLNMPKQGFQIPIAKWFNEDLKDFVYDIINSSDNQYFRKEYVKNMILAHNNGRKNYSDIIYSILIFELWRKNINAN